jgi:hypothetical protein
MRGAASLVDTPYSPEPPCRIHETLLRQEVILAASIIAGTATILVAIIGALLSYLNTQRLHRLEARLSRVNDQLSNLYGPMLATLEANRIAYRRFLDSYREGSPSFFNPKLPPPDQQQLEAWRDWVTTVLQPGNRRVYEMIVGRAHLLIDDQIPSCLLKLCAHTSGYEVVLKRWEKGDFSRHLSVVAHPRTEIDDYAERCFAQLKETQAKLLAQTR